MNGYKQQAQNDYNGLLWIKKFLWLRNYELGMLLWPDDLNWSRTRADRVIRSWSKRGLMILRELPERQGHAVFLTPSFMVNGRTLPVFHIFRRPARNWWVVQRILG